VIAVLVSIFINESLLSLPSIRGNLDPLQRGGPFSAKIRLWIHLKEFRK